MDEKANKKSEWKNSRNEEGIGAEAEVNMHICGDFGIHFSGGDVANDSREEQMSVDGHVSRYGHEVRVWRGVPVREHVSQ